MWRAWLIGLPSRAAAEEKKPFKAAMVTPRPIQATFVLLRASAALNRASLSTHLLPYWSSSASLLCSLGFGAMHPLLIYNFSHPASLLFFPLVPIPPSPHCDGCWNSALPFLYSILLGGRRSNYHPYEKTTHSDTLNAKAA